VTEAVFAANFPNLTAPSELTQHEAGPLGGEVWCASYPDVGSSACGWIDQTTVGYAFGSGLTEADLAGRLVDMRNDIEIVP
jgi:hypothetical protein